MADRGSWRNRNEASSGSGGGGGGNENGKDGIGKNAAIKVASTSSSDTINIPGSSQFSNKQRQSNLHAIRRSRAEENGPASPLQPLHISAGRPLPHPSSYAGTDNWAFTPSDTLPSLPATPSRAMHVLGWNRASTPAAGGENGNNAGPSTGYGNGQNSETNNRYPQSTPSRDKSVALGARAVLNKRMEDQRNYSPSPVRNQRPSPRVGMSSLTSPSHATTRTGNFGIPPSSSDVATTNSTSSGQAQSITAVLNQANSSNETGSPAMMPALRHRDSVQSIASSTNQSLGQHMLAHSRRPSQVFTASPALSNATGSSNVRPNPPYRVYRPPHLRTDSYFSLQPKVAHYDRVSAPMLRGQSRSPSVSRSRSDSVSISRTPSESNFSSVSPRMGHRRLSNLSSQEPSQANQNQTLPGYGSGFDSNSLIAKLANAKLDLSGRTSGHSQSTFDDQSQEIIDDVDLSVEDMMMSGTLTDQFYRSRTASISSTQGALIDIFEIGDRLGPKMMHDGHEITIAQTSDGFNEQSADWTGTQLEIVSKLGEGSYAVVYLVKEVPRMEGLHQISVTPVTSSSIDRSRDVFLEEGDQTFADETILQNGDLYGTTLKASASGRLAEDKQDRDQSKSSTKLEGRYFALKCLCKRDLSEDMLEVQRLESTIHQSIPRHPNIVTLYRTYETPEWLFLVLEYCPGQDLFYWLEQAHDTENLGASTPGGNSDEADADLTAMDSTPPSPSLLASTNSRFLLSRRRLKLISRMFQQICEAVGFCHDRGISHRDIKPENFIVEDTRGSDFANNTENKDKELDVDNQIHVKLTDFGLAVAQTRCIDFDCGSKPYMSYECRNNTTRWYNPIESDIWSLGIVLLNLIFHRNPFMEPNVERCPSFASYVQDPIRFLTTAFRGLTHEAARFLAEKVFCDVTEGEDESERRHRISAREFGEWASNLADHLESHENRQNKQNEYSSTNFLSPNMDNHSAGADIGITSPLWHSRSPSSSIVNSLMASPATNSKSINIYQELAHMGISEEEIDSFTPLFTDSITMPDKQQREPSTMTETNLEPIAETVGSAPSSSEHKSTDIEQISTNDLSMESPISNEAKDSEENEQSTVETSVENESSVKAEEVDLTDDVSERDDQSIFPPASVTSTSANSKRRKRGARKGRTLAKQELKRSHSAENLHTEEERFKKTESARDQVIRELAEASQSLAREMSKVIQNRGETNKSDLDSANAIDMPTRSVPLPASRQTISPQTAMELKELQSRLAVPEFDAATTTVSSLNSVSRGSTTSRASSHFTNYGWGDSRRIGGNAVSESSTGRYQDESMNSQMQQSNVSLLMKNRLAGGMSQNGARNNLQDSGRGRVIHPSSTAADWRERNTSNASLASISSINTLNSFSSEIESIHSTASAPPAMMTQYHHRRGGSGLSSLQNVPQTNSSASSARSVGLSGMRTGGGGSSNASISSRNIIVPGSRNLGTINERGNTAQSNLDASYLAGIFGGKGSQSSTTKNQKGEIRAGAPSQTGKGFVGGVLDNASARGSFASQRSLNDNRSNLYRMRSGNENESNVSLDRSSISFQSESSESFANHENISVPRKKMLGKFLQGVKNYNKGVKAAPAMLSDDQESSDTGAGTETSAGASSGTPGKSTSSSSVSKQGIKQVSGIGGSGMHIQMQ